MIMLENLQGRNLFFQKKDDNILAELSQEHKVSQCMC